MNKLFINENKINKNGEEDAEQDDSSGDEEDDHDEDSRSVDDGGHDLVKWFSQYLFKITFRNFLISKIYFRFKTFSKILDLIRIYPELKFDLPVK